MSNMVTKIPDACFSLCKKLKFQIPDFIQNLGYCSFSSCESLEEIVIPNGVSLNNGSIFSDCINVKTITLPSTLTYIGPSVFSNIPANVVYCYAVAPPALAKYSYGGGMNFNSVDKNTAKLYVPMGSSDAYRKSDWGKYFSNIIEIDNK